MITLLWILFSIGCISVLAFNRASLRVWTLGLFFLLFLISVLSNCSVFTLTVLWVIFAALALFLNITPLRRALFSNRVLAFYRRIMPSMSQTEEEALNAGDLDWTAEVFSGMPDWKKLAALPRNSLSAEEQAFLAGPVEKLCAMLSDWKITQIDRDIPLEVWEHLKNEGYFGLIIPKKFGGKEFSALAHAQIIAKVSSVSVSVATTLSVPNSLGPAELLLKYGTEDQQNYYLPRLARGEEIPCFGLTSPVAGSDASSITDSGIICNAEIDGKMQLAIRLNWNKRYITLSPIATLIGLAFKLYDPENLLGKKTELGITCALIPSDTQGVVTGRRHYPVCSAFLNGPTQGHDVLIPIERIIGGAKMAGQGWRMLMECLAAGRGISLPSMVSGGIKKSVFTSGAYARIRRQFNTYIGSFGGVEEALAQILGLGYISESLRMFTLSYLDRGIHPVVASAVSKYHSTELARKILNHAMDVHGGKGICMGPNNYLAQNYIEGPVSITVEGANILTRSMIIFGQGAMRCHPYVHRELSAAKNPDKKQAAKEFDKALFAHFGYLISNKVRAFYLAISRGRFALAPKSPLKRYYQMASRYSAAFAYVADMSMLVLGGSLKRREQLSARLGDALSNLYMISAVLKHYEIESNPESLPVAEWACQYLLKQTQGALNELLINFPNRFVAAILRCVIFPWFSGRLRLPSDRLGAKLANLMITPSRTRERVSQHVYVSNTPLNPLRDFSAAFQQAMEVEPLLKKIADGVKSGALKGKNLSENIELAQRCGILSISEAQAVLAADVLKMKIINVDDFSNDELK